MELQDTGTTLVYTIRDRCRVCYTCVRECPVKAIRIINGQAEIIPARCIGCGNCTQVCSQGAKVYLKSLDAVASLLQQDDPVAAIVAPSYAAEFDEIGDPRIFTGMVRALGFDYVMEVAFGADLITQEYKKFFEQHPEHNYISSDCPAIVSYIEKFHPELIPNLVPVVSPMVATTRTVRKKLGTALQVVFIGPCIAKKAESDEVTQAITFRELRQLFKMNNIEPGMVIPSEFDPPAGGKGSIFPVSRGMLQSLEMNDDLFEQNVLVADGRVNFQEAIREFIQGSIVPKHMELLCCEGCIMGPGMSRGTDKFSRLARLSSFVREKLKNYDAEYWKKEIEDYGKLDLSRQFTDRKQIEQMPSEQEIEQILRTMGKESPQDYLDCGACGYDTCRNHAIAIIRGLAENEMCLPFTIGKLHRSIQDLAISRDKLFAVQQALKQSEKLAHMGQLSAGIAHELNNPLGVIIMYSNILLDECSENENLRKDLQLIVDQSARCKSIVAGLLNFARKNQVNHTLIDAKTFFEKCFRSVIIPHNIQTSLESRLITGTVSFDQDQMMQVVTNLIKNSVEAMPTGGKISILLEEDINDFSFTISDTGQGINQENLNKVFEPFFTTKGIGKGTGLGLATAYGIVKMHKGQISVNSNANPEAGSTGTSFKIVLPRNTEEISQNTVTD
ncbi:MAG: [Fe-Fe] hydrogenase large subunit C-terminal domain-containing protein [Bacteroidales bacterium]